MPENQIPATQPEPGAEPGEFNFAQPKSETSRIKRRTLKTKQAGLIKPTGSTPPAARDLEQEAPPLSPEEARRPRPRLTEVVSGSVKATPKVATTTDAPPRTTPSIASSMARELASASAEAKATTAPAVAASSSSATAPSPSIRSTATPSTSPHGTRPATLYYSSQPRKAETPKAETPVTSPAASASTSPMKTIPTAPASSASSTTSPTATSSSASRPMNSASTTTRSSAPIDYRTNVERQSREQKSVGSLLSYVVYGFIAIFIVGALLAAYGANVIFERINSQSVTVSELDAHYAAATKDLNAKLAAAQDTVSQAQAQIARQQDLIVKQQDEINKLINTANDNSTAIKNERSARAQETSNLRIRLRQVEYRQAQQQQKP